MSVTITAATPEHVTPLVSLLEEMDRFYGDSDLEPPPVRTQQVHAALFADPPLAHALLAWKDDQLAGLASYSFLWPAVGSTTSLYLKELYVTQAWRGQGIGRMLMRQLFQVAADRRCSRVEWTTDQDNGGAQAFYEALDLCREPSKLFYRADQEVMKRQLG